MNRKKTILNDEPYLYQEIFLGMAIAVGMILMMVNSLAGKLVLIIGVAFISGIYISRILRVFQLRNNFHNRLLSSLNNLAMLIVSACTLMLLLMKSHHETVFYSGLGMIVLTCLLDFIFLYNDKGINRFTLLLRLMIALIVLIVFFLL
ncbi:MAG: hypothetical protein KKA81_03180 [Bacteroidetes bacterium]|nr:hypothetical protein [Bacteroidota bacterium]